ncbi:MAG: hypothetical protein V2A58_18760 [Planctomycetota bacterium]
MKLFKSRVWSPWDVVCGKWSSILFGMIVGAYLAEFTKRYVWAFAAAAVILAIKPTVSYLRDGK